MSNVVSSVELALRRWAKILQRKPSKKQVTDGTEEIFWYPVSVEDPNSLPANEPIVMQVTFNFDFDKADRENNGKADSNN